MLCCRRISAIWTPASPCFKISTIWLSVNRDFRMATSLTPESLPSKCLPEGEASQSRAPIWSQRPLVLLGADRDNAKPRVFALRYVPWPRERRNHYVQSHYDF